MWFNSIDFSIQNNSLGFNSVLGLDKKKKLYNIWNLTNFRANFVFVEVFWQISIQNIKLDNSKQSSLSRDWNENGTWKFEEKNQLTNWES